MHNSSQLAHQALHLSCLFLVGSAKSVFLARFCMVYISHCMSFHTSVPRTSSHQCLFAYSNSFMVNFGSGYFLQQTIQLYRFSVKFVIDMQCKLIIKASFGDHMHILLVNSHCESLQYRGNKQDRQCIFITCSVCFYFCYGKGCGTYLLKLLQLVGVWVTLTVVAVDLQLSLQISVQQYSRYLHKTIYDSIVRMFAERTIV